MTSHFYLIQNVGFTFRFSSPSLAQSIKLLKRKDPQKCPEYLLERCDYRREIPLVTRKTAFSSYIHTS